MPGKTVTAHWLVKSEPSAYSWQDLVRDKTTEWTGVRNFQARNHLQQMKKGDLVLFYHSVTDKQIAGVAKVAREAAPDPSAEAGSNWVSVELKPVKSLKHPVSLERIKKEPRLSGISLLRQSRLSVMKLTAAEFQTVLELSQSPASQS
jgi:predicted RNA-binding protein with PUA-like domain